MQYQFSGLTKSRKEPSLAMYPFQKYNDAFDYNSYNSMCLSRIFNVVDYSLKRNELQNEYEKYMSNVHRILSNRYPIYEWVYSYNELQQEYGRELYLRLLRSRSSFNQPLHIPFEYRKGRLPTSVNIPSSSWNTNRQNVPRPNNYQGNRLQNWSRSRLSFNNSHRHKIINHEYNENRSSFFQKSSRNQSLSFNQSRRNIQFEYKEINSPELSRSRSLFRNTCRRNRIQPEPKRDSFLWRSSRSPSITIDNIHRRRQQFEYKNYKSPSFSNSSSSKHTHKRKVRQKFKKERKSLTSSRSQSSSSNTSSNITICKDEKNGSIISLSSQSSSLNIISKEPTKSNELLKSTEEKSRDSSRNQSLPKNIYKATIIPQANMEKEPSSSKSQSQFKNKVHQKETQCEILKYKPLELILPMKQRKDLNKLGQDEIDKCTNEPKSKSQQLSLNTSKQTKVHHNHCKKILKTFVKQNISTTINDLTDNYTANVLESTSKYLSLSLNKSKTQDNIQYEHNYNQKSFSWSHKNTSEPFTRSSYSHIKLGRDKCNNMHSINSLLSINLFSHREFEDENVYETISPDRSSGELDEFGHSFQHKTKKNDLNNIESLKLRNKYYDAVSPSNSETEHGITINKNMEI